MADIEKLNEYGNEKDELKIAQTALYLSFFAGQMSLTASQLVENAFGAEDKEKKPNSFQSESCK